MIAFFPKEHHLPTILWSLSYCIMLQHVLRTTTFLCMNNLRQRNNFLRHPMRSIKQDWCAGESGLWPAFIFLDLSDDTHQILICAWLQPCLFLVMSDLKIVEHVLYRSSVSGLWCVAQIQPQAFIIDICSAYNWDSATVYTCIHTYFIKTGIIGPCSADPQNSFARRHSCVPSTPVYRGTHLC